MARICCDVGGTQRNASVLFQISGSFAGLGSSIPHWYSEFQNACALPHKKKSEAVVRAQSVALRRDFGNLTRGDFTGEGRKVPSDVGNRASTEPSGSAAGHPRNGVVSRQPCEALVRDHAGPDTESLLQHMRRASSDFLSADSARGTTFCKSQLRCTRTVGSGSGWGDSLMASQSKRFALPGLPTASAAGWDVPIDRPPQSP